MRYVDEYSIDEIYKEVQAFLSAHTYYSYSNPNEPSGFYKAIKKYENLRWSGCELDRVSFFAYRTTYSDMTGLQFAYYIYWRTKVLSGDVQYCDNSYFFVFVYELLAGFHTNSAEEGYRLLLNVYKEYQKYDNYPNRYLPTWILGYCIIHGIYDDKKVELEELSSSNKSQKYNKEKILNGDYSDCFDTVMSASAYKMHKNSRFYTSRKDAKIVDLVFDEAMSAIDKCMREHDLVLPEFMIGKVGKEKWRLLQATPWENNLSSIVSNIKYNRTFVYDDITDNYIVEQ